MKFPKRKEVAAYSLLRRLHNKLYQQKSILRKRMDLSFVTLGEQTYKRIKFTDNQTPKHFNEILQNLQSSGNFPEVFHLHENELWVEYIKGTLLDGSTMNKHMCFQFGQFYSNLYKIDCKLVNAEPYAYQLKKTLQFHQQMKIISSDELNKLLELLEKVTPENIWQGIDYTDAITKNFLISTTNKNFIGIDIESIQSNSLLGCGLAKALARWMPSSNFDLVMQYIKAQEGPAFHEHMDFIHLYFRAQWLKSLFLRYKIKRLKQNQHLLRELI